MTRKRLSRVRRKYNASRRVHRGWQPKRWDVLLTDNADDPEYSWWLRCVDRNYAR